MEAFRSKVWALPRRDFPWREPETDGSFDPYKILVSEIMLQQTQVSRVVPKYEAFLQTFPTVKDLAKADLAAVLRAWSGLGYNRRAKFLYQAAQRLMVDYDGQVPNDLESLMTLPGVGRETAGAIMVYAFNQPVVYIETNIRSVFIHHFFKDKQGVSDAELRPQVERALEGQEPRPFYWALMDYGTYLKGSVGNTARQSKHYTKQSTFTGSKRQLRGLVLRLLGEASASQLSLQRSIPDERLTDILAELQREGLIDKDRNQYCLATKLGV